MPGNHPAGGFTPPGGWILAWKVRGGKLNTPDQSAAGYSVRSCVSMRRIVRPLAPLSDERRPFHAGIFYASGTCGIYFVLLLGTTSSVTLCAGTVVLIACPVTAASGRCTILFADVSCHTSAFAAG